MTRNVLMISGLSAALLLAGCGSDSSSGGSGQNTPPITTTPAEGAQGSWQGTITDGSGLNNRQTEITTLSDGSFWMVYAQPTDTTLLNAAGIVHGTATVSENGSLTVNNATQLSLDGTNTKSAVGISADYVTGSSLDGTIVGPAGSPLAGVNTFSTLYQMAYNNNLTLAHLQGKYTGALSSNTGKQNISMTIAADGAITGTTNDGCSITGQATQRERSNVFNLTVTYGNESGCGTNLIGLTLNGIVSQELDRIAATAMDDAKANGFVFIGRK